MKYLVYILRNIRRNPLRSALTAASIAVCIGLMVALASFFAVTNDAAKDVATENRLVTMSSQGFAGKVPIKLANEIAALKGIQFTTPFSWFGGKYQNKQAYFAQFGINPDTIFKIYPELTISTVTARDGSTRTREQQLADFKNTRNGCFIGVKLAEDFNLKVGDKMPLEANLYPVSLDLDIVGIYGGPEKRDLRMVMFNWDYLNEKLKAEGFASRADNAGTVFSRCESADVMTGLIRKIDDNYRPSDTPTKTQTEEAFIQMFSEYLGNLQDLLLAVGFAVVLALLLVSGNAMAMSLRERTTEIAVLKAIGFSKPLVLLLILAESILVAGIGGLIGAGGTYFLFKMFDPAKLSAFLNGFYILEPIAVWGIFASLAIGFLAGVVPAVVASNLSVINGLRKVV
jgi:putative ABC transport system permease protein